MTILDFAGIGAFLLGVTEGDIAEVQNCREEVPRLVDLGVRELEVSHGGNDVLKMRSIIGAFNVEVRILGKHTHIHTQRWYR